MDDENDDDSISVSTYLYLQKCMPIKIQANWLLSEESMLTHRILGAVGYGGKNVQALSATAIKKIIFKTEQKPLLNRVKIKNSKSLSRPLEVYIEAI